MKRMEPQRRPVRGELGFAKGKYQHEYLICEIGSWLREPGALRHTHRARLRASRSAGDPGSRRDRGATRGEAAGRADRGERIHLRGSAEPRARDRKSVV